MMFKHGFWCPYMTSNVVFLQLVSRITWKLWNRSVQNLVKKMGPKKQTFELNADSINISISHWLIHGFKLKSCSSLSSLLFYSTFVLFFLVYRFIFIHFFKGCCTLIIFNWWSKCCFNTAANHFPAEDLSSKWQNINIHPKIKPSQLQSHQLNLF